MAKNTNANTNSVTSIYTNTYTSFSGADMVATIDINLPTKDGQMQKITKVLGSMMTMSYSIHMEKSPVRSLGSVNAKDYVFGPRTIAGSLVFAQFNRHIAHDILLEAESAAENKHSQMIVMDELPPFNITVSMANEYGKKARFAIYGVRIVNEGSVISVNDVYTENTYQFVATDIEYLTDSSSSAGSSGTAAAYYNTKLVAYNAQEAPMPVPSFSSAYYEDDDWYVEVDEEESSVSVKNDKTPHNVPEEPENVNVGGGGSSSSGSGTSPNVPQ